MAFERSPLGQRNRALFLNVDAIVYVEGGRGRGDKDESFDAMFWKKVFQAFRTDLRVKIIAKGSKQNIIALISQVGDSIIDNVFYAMDRDYDDLINKAIDGKNVLYTFGYSFENDIFSVANLPTLFENICPVFGGSEAIVEDVQSATAEFARDVWWAHLADLAGVITARAVIDRKSPQKYFGSHSYGAKPKILKTMLSSDVYKANADQTRVRVRNLPLTTNMLPRYVVGHLYSAFVFKLMVYLHKLHSSTSKLTKDAVTAAGVLTLCNHFLGADNSDIKSYYTHIMSI
jgi:hypothetical protein